MNKIHPFFLWWKINRIDPHRIDLKFGAGILLIKSFVTGGSELFPEKLRIQSTDRVSYAWIILSELLLSQKFGVVCDPGFHNVSPCLKYDMRVQSTASPESDREPFLQEWVRVKR